MDKPQKIYFEQRYSDDSGIEYGVRYENNKGVHTIEIESVDTISIPLDKIDWVIECINYTKEQIQGT